LSCGLTHAAVTPLDHVKCNVQANPQHFKNTVQGFRAIYSGSLAAQGYGSGPTALLKGWGPTMAGYGVQGLCKFGFYELFKHGLSTKLGEENAIKYRDLVYLVSSAGAEFIADAAYCPFEALKVRLQTSPTFAKGLLDGMPKFIAEEGVGQLYAGLGPLWARQIPYTVIKFMAFERIAEFFYGIAPKAKEDMTYMENLGVIFASGYTAGVICGAVSHPADTLVSKINKVKMDGGLVAKSKVILDEIGFSGLWKGFGPRVIMIGTLTGLQWFIYGSYKAAVGLPTPGKSVKK